MLYQQGDVLINKIDKLPDNAIKDKIKKGKWIIAEGEATGHCHAIAEKEAIVYLKEGKKYVITKQGFNITHQEHKPITVDPGVYEIGIIREYDPFEDLIRRVQD